MIALRLLIAFVSRGLQWALYARQPQAEVTSSVCEEVEGGARRELTATRWDVLKYAIDDTARTVRLCLLILVIVLAALLAVRFGWDASVVEWLHPSSSARTGR